MSWTRRTLLLKRRFAEFDCSFPLEPHQALLARQGVLVEVEESKAVVFVSHQWLGNTHADPSMSHLVCLK